MVLELPLFQSWLLHHKCKFWQPNSTCVHFNLYLQAGVFFSSNSFFQKCCYKWRPRKCLGLDVANLNFFNQKMAKTLHENGKIFMIFFIFWKQIHPSSENLSQQKKNTAYKSQKKVNNQIKHEISKSVKRVFAWKLLNATCLSHWKSGNFFKGTWLQWEGWLTTTKNQGPKYAYKSYAFFFQMKTPTEDIIFTLDISPQLVVFDWVLLYWSQALLDSQEVLVGNGFTLGS
jgi:hypothetical protein